jgi:hypothetical protein
MSVDDGLSGHGENGVVNLEIMSFQTRSKKSSQFSFKKSGNSH